MAEVAAKIKVVAVEVSLRDLFAIAAFQGILTTFSSVPHLPADWDYIAKNAYQAANAMEAARKEQPNHEKKTCEKQ